MVDPGRSWWEDTSVDPIQDQLVCDLKRIADSLDVISKAVTEFLPIVRAVYGPDAAGPLSWAVRRQVAKEARNGNR